MTIDTTTVRLFTCCKCGHRWTNWDRLKQQDSESLPVNCPKCRNVRWNQHYTDEDLELIYQVLQQHYVEFNAETEKDGYAAILRKITGQLEPEDASAELIHIHHFDFIAYDFLFKLIPMPDVFELKQVLAIPFEEEQDIEARHELMLSIINDRVTNQEKYTKEHFSKYLMDNEEHPHHKSHKYKDSMVKGGSKKRRKMPECKHEEHSPELLMALYVEPSYRLPYYYIQHPFDMHRFERMPDERSNAVYEKVKVEVQRIHEAELKEDEAKPEFARAIRKFKEEVRKRQEWDAENKDEDDDDTGT